MQQHQVLAKSARLKEIIKFILHTVPDAFDYKSFFKMLNTKDRVVKVVLLQVAFQEICI